eukprot:NODE_14575_length_340_cov_2.285223_g13412_i0.p2 GENE.NODE_14575_length_340_cov_2.285223_g13412_i0~~NODE_14575_length_340_cov_2.285223_g13412_i0.p2  ORF type:complete len:71 (-),score=4.62 NODE_14575_length_340_cov_2.285223_g13412_i0:62-274(-)
MQFLSFFAIFGDAHARSALRDFCVAAESTATPLKVLAGEASLLLRGEILRSPKEVSLLWLPSEEVEGRST